MPVPASAFREHRITTWADFYDAVTSDDYRGWAFRGHSEAHWSLITSIGRLLTQYNVQPDAWKDQEARVNRIFRRKAHLYLGHVPPDNDDFQWLALMQHHGAPTRLLDFTWSPFVAAFFALESATSDAAVWAICVPKLWRETFVDPTGGAPLRLSDLKLNVSGNYGRWYLDGRIRFLAQGEPLVMNQRLIAQSGTFVVPSTLDAPVESIVSGYNDPSGTLVKFTLSTVALRDAGMYALYNMNISYATLFPGLDGMARSLAYELEYDWYRNPKTLTPYPGFGARDEHY
jgi:hypothetical protein